MTSNPQYPNPNSGGFQQQSPYGPPRNNGFAITSMVLSLVSIVLLCAWGSGLLTAILGVIFGHIAKGQIRRDGTAGGGMATAGIVIGYCIIGLAVLGIVGIIVLGLNLSMIGHT